MGEWAGAGNLGAVCFVFSGMQGEGRLVTAGPCPDPRPRPHGEQHSPDEVVTGALETLAKKEPARSEAEKEPRRGRRRQIGSRHCYRSHQLRYFSASAVTSLPGRLGGRGGGFCAV